MLKAIVQRPVFAIVFMIVLTGIFTGTGLQPTVQDSEQVKALQHRLEARFEEI